MIFNRYIIIHLRHVTKAHNNTRITKKISGGIDIDVSIRRWIY